MKQFIIVEPHMDVGPIKEYFLPHYFFLKYNELKYNVKETFPPSERMETSMINFSISL